MLVLSVALWACGGQQDEPATGSSETVTEETATEAPAATIAGRTLTTTVTAEEGTAEPLAVGTWDLALAEDGSFEVTDASVVQARRRDRFGQALASRMTAPLARPRS